MKVIAAAFAASLIAGSAYAQATPPAQTTTPPASPPPTELGGSGAASNRAAETQTTRPGGRGAFIKMRGPGGSHVAVRCADGESTRTCAETVMMLVERTRGTSGDRRRDWDDDDDGRGGRERHRGRDY